MDETEQNLSILAMLPPVTFLTGIGTDVGKSYATGWIVRELGRLGKNVITQKLVQTGCHNYSEDIMTHRRICNLNMYDRDLDHTTAPLILSYPASPHLAAKIDGETLDWQKAKDATKILSQEFDYVVIEGAGGVMVPLDEQQLTIDYIQSEKLPAILVTNGQLGSINHTLLTVEALQRRNIEIAMVVYNPHFDTDRIIAADTRHYFKKYFSENFPETIYLEMPAEL